MSVRKSQTTLDGSFKVSYNSASARARLYNREFSITVEDLKKQFEKQDGKCAITGKSLNHTIKQNGKAKSPFNMSLDRIDSSKGYTVDNIQWVCVWIQTAKSDWDEAEFKQWIVDAGKYIKQKAV